MWLLLAIAAQFLFALVSFVDKHIIMRAAHIGRPIVYAFFVSIMSGSVIVLVPFFDISMPSAALFLWSLGSASAFVAALLFFYGALGIGRASDIAPVVGAISAITTLILAGFFINGDVTPSTVLVVALLAAGTALISRFHFTRSAFLFSFLAGVLFGFSIFFAKLVYTEAGFLNGFVWTRALFFMVALAFLLLPSLRLEIFRGGRHSSGGAKALVVGNKIAGSFAGVLTAYAVSLGDVSVVNALSGLQFAFLFFFALFFAKRMPKFADSGVSPNGHGGWHTALGVLLIMVGLALVYATGNYL